MKIVIELAGAIAIIAMTMALDVRRGHAFGDAPWCAVSEIGAGFVVWDCQYRTVEECVPNVIAGNRGFCSLNPYGPGRAAPGRPARPRRH